MYEIWAKDQYGRHEILSSLSTKGRPETEWATADEALAAAKRYVHNENFKNAMTLDTQKRDAKFLVPELDGGYYAGNLIMGRHKVITASTGAESALASTDQFRFYVGDTPDGQPWYMEDARRRRVTDLSNYLVADKTIVFIKKR